MRLPIQTEKEKTKMPAAFDSYDTSVGNIVPQRPPILPNAEECIDRNCKYFNRYTNVCALAGCAKTIPEIVNNPIGRLCDICGGTFFTDVLSAASVCPTCSANIRRAIAQSHPKQCPK